MAAAHGLSSCSAHRPSLLLPLLLFPADLLFTLLFATGLLAGGSATPAVESSRRLVFLRDTFGLELSSNFLFFVESNGIDDWSETIDSVGVGAAAVVVGMAALKELELLPMSS
ncbi:hypothetical protein MIMGU_mgv1a016666mg [Erythranthe guttata]|uniref:Uncharacterized protein n=1 Tax=Erythranthe guttata TaxID=4155 RepID=A0A022PZU4_ERYGU|nr:hypothetical protein MIMGU_mgv1a016666mg [Erythranthe guttata]